jgi:hypothetical protein
VERSQPDRRIETTINDILKRLRVLEEVSTSRVLPPNYGFRLNSGGQLVIFNRATGAENKESPEPAKESLAKDEKTKAVVKTIRVEATGPFATAETGDLRKGEQAVLNRTKTVAALIKAGYLLEVK